MRDVVLLSIHLLVTLAKFLRPGGVRAVVAESLVLKHQLLICNRSRQRAPNLTGLDRLLLGLTAMFMHDKVPVWRLEREHATLQTHATAPPRHRPTDYRSSGPRLLFAPTRGPLSNTEAPLTDVQPIQIRNYVPETSVTLLQAIHPIQYRPAATGKTTR